MRLISLLLVIVFFASCKKDNPEDVVVQGTLENGMLVLCEGLFQQNNSSISWVNFQEGTTTDQFFNSRAGRQLGDTGNDIQRYGGKIYVVVNVSSTIEVLSASSFNSIKQISMETGGIAKQPRSIAFYGSNAYVTCFDGFVDVIDTVTLTITQRIPVGSNPEGIVADYGKLFVSNSGGLNLPLMDSTISIIDPNLNTEINRVTVGQNPGAVVSDGLGDVYVICRGNYGANPSRLVRLDAISEVATPFSFDISMMTKMNNYIAYSDGNVVNLFDPSLEMIDQLNFMNISNLTTPFGLSYSAFNNKIYVFDAMNYTNTGYVHQYSGVGNFETSFHVGLNPSKAIFFE